MRKIPIPICTCCKTVRAEWESAKWPTVQLCYICTRELAQFIIEKLEVTHGNPILVELVRGVVMERESNGITEHRIWCMHDNAAREFWVKESRVTLEDSA